MPEPSPPPCLTRLPSFCLPPSGTVVQIPTLPRRRMSLVTLVQSQVNPLLGLHDEAEPLYQKLRKIGSPPPHEPFMKSRSDFPLALASVYSLQNVLKLITRRAGPPRSLPGPSRPGKPCGACGSEWGLIGLSRVHSSQRIYYNFHFYLLSCFGLIIAITVIIILISCSRNIIKKAYLTNVM